MGSITSVFTERRGQPHNTVDENPAMTRVISEYLDLPRSSQELEELLYGHQQWVLHLGRVVTERAQNTHRPCTFKLLLASDLNAPSTSVRSYVPASLEI